MSNSFNRVIFLLILICFSSNLIRIGSFAFAEIGEENIELYMQLLESEDDETKIIEYPDNIKAIYSSFSEDFNRSEWLKYSHSDFHYNEPFLDQLYSPPDLLV